MNQPVPAVITDLAVITSYDGLEVMEMAYRADEARNEHGEWTGGLAFHGTSAELKPGDLITPGHEKNTDVTSAGHVYFASERHYGAAVQSAHRAVKRRGGAPHVYQVEPTGDAEADPDFAVSGGSFRSRSPLRVVSEDESWKSDPRFSPPPAAVTPRRQRMANMMSAGRDHEDSHNLGAALQRYQLALRYAAKADKPQVQAAIDRVSAARRR